MGWGVDEMPAMRRMTALGLWAAALCGLLSAAGVAAAPAGVRDDDLQVVKRAVQDKAAPPAAQEKSPALDADEKQAPRSPTASPRWLRVRISEPGGKRVRVNLPLSLARAVGDWPIDIGCHRRDGKARSCASLRLSELLQALDKGESLVEIEDEGTSVRVWVE